MAEKGVLSILLNNPYALKKAVVYLTQESFYVPEHKLLFRALIFLYEQKKPISLTTVVSYFLDRNLLKSVGGTVFVLDLVNRRESMNHLMDYIKLLNEKEIRRKLVQLGEDLIKSGYRRADSPEEIFENVEHRLFTITQQQLVDHTFSTGELMINALEELQEKSHAAPSGYLTSYKDLDLILQGFQKSDMTVIAGRPSMGKTAFALNLSTRIVKEYNLPVIFFSLEMSRAQLLHRLLSTEAFVSGSKLRLSKMNRQEWGRVAKAGQLLANLPLYVEDNPHVTLNQMKAKIRKVFLEHKDVGLVVIDYLQLMKLTIKLENRVQEIAHITRNLKFLAKEFNIPVLVLSQLSRNVESRVNKKPILSDLRESGSIEQDADVVLMLYREDYYANPRPKDSPRTLMEIIVAKHRNGPLGQAELIFDADITRFFDKSEFDALED